ncbi:hypothetical protein TQ39_07580 [Ruthenibacterium lactatiformans]|uniref:Uncharacterized protein n=1 Tax=Ruthenibacterium lactatiformans TaxID=1550024 RepID=A0A0D8J148_9FIRM|nr:hypothetical protein TQ39_07580 [Ruthenibacterium lactatiformans]
MFIARGCWMRINSIRKFSVCWHSGKNSESVYLFCVVYDTIIIYVVNAFKHISYTLVGNCVIDILLCRGVII